ncbi:MAG: hypothetical protein CL910_01075 [Deltaproteobacteria bacterium]|nr:hypothetical protein [Deltaproteobacteria bacterium]
MPGSGEPAAPRTPSGAAPVWAAGLAEAGLAVLAPAAVAAYDAIAPPSLRSGRLLPGAAGAWVIGADRRLFERARRGDGFSLDTHTERTLAHLEIEAAREGGRCVAVLGHRAAPDGATDLVALARAAGLGWPSRLGLLLHPDFGLWWSLRAALLTTLPGLSASPLAGPGPCGDCPAPCATACPAGAPRPDGFDTAACAGVRSRGGPCVSSCQARRACPAGAEHAYPEEALRHVMEASLEPVLAWARSAGHLEPNTGK